jgi:chemotaxis protein CheZ
MTGRKLFTAELQRMKALQERMADQPAAGSVSVDNSEVLKAIQDLRSDIRSLESAVRGDESNMAAALAAEEDLVRSKQAEVSMLRTEIRALANSIEQTKHEIAALRPKDAEEDRLIAVTFELDAIVSSTERATQQILESAEKVEGLARDMLSHTTDAYVHRIVEDIGETIIGIFEACNFQDITGQRITKVVRTLKYVEDRINTMIEIWGAENIAEVVPKAAAEHQDEEAKLLNGPQLDSKAISQDEIDKLFG